MLLCLGCLWLALAGLANVPRVAFLHPPALVSEDALVTYYVRVLRHEDNRLLIVAAMAEDGMVSETRRQLDGAHSAPLVNVNWRLPAGEMQLVAAVFSQTEQVGRAVHPLVVYAVGP